MLLWAMFWDWRIDSSGCGNGGHSDSLPCLPIRGIYAKIMRRKYVLYNFSNGPIWYNIRVLDVLTGPG